MENQHIEADVVYVNNRGQDSSEFEYRDGNNSPPPLPVKAPNLTLNLPKRSPIIKPGSPIAEGSPRATGRAIESHKYPSIQVDLGTGTGTGTKYTRDRTQDTSFETVVSESSKDVEDLIKSKKRKSKVVSKYVIATFFLTNIMILGFSILGTILVINKFHPCLCADTPIRTSQAHVQLPVEPTESPSLKNSEAQNSQGHTRTYQDTKGKSGTHQDTKGQTRKHLDAVDKDYTISILVQNTTAESDDFWSSRR